MGIKCPFRQAQSHHTCLPDTNSGPMLMCIEAWGRHWVSPPWKPATRPSTSSASRYLFLRTQRAAVFSHPVKPTAVSPWIFYAWASKVCFKNSACQIQLTKFSLPERLKPSATSGETVVRHALAHRLANARPSPENQVKSPKHAAHG